MDRRNSILERKKKPYDGIERRGNIPDRRKQKFGRRGPKLLVNVANWLTQNPNAFYCYMVISIFLFFYTLANLAYNLNQLILKFFKGLIK